MCVLHTFTVGLDCPGTATIDNGPWVWVLALKIYPVQVELFWLEKPNTCETESENEPGTGCNQKVWDSNHRVLIRSMICISSYRLSVQLNGELEHKFWRVLLQERDRVDEVASHLYHLNEKEIVSEINSLSCSLNILKFLWGPCRQQNPSGRGSCNVESERQCCARVWVISKRNILEFFKY